MQAPADPDWYEPTLAFQLAANPATWGALQAHGVTEASELRLDFLYDAPSEASARALLEFIGSSTDYDAAVRTEKRGLFSKRAWVVAGTTRPTHVSLQILNEWVTWMVAAGVSHGACKFDGWGALAAPAPA